MAGKDMIIVAVFAAVFCLTSAQTVTPANHCNTTGLAPCFIAFFNHFGFNGMFPANASTFERALNAYINQASDASKWGDVRTWMHALEDCAGRHNLNECLRWQNIMNDFGIPMRDAQDWDVAIRTLEYETGPGYLVLTQNWFCIQGVNQHEGPIVRQCRQAFINAEHNQPNMTCQHASDLLQCIERPYANNCGVQVGNLVCRIERFDFEVYFPQCNEHLQYHCSGLPLASSTGMPG